MDPLGVQPQFGQAQGTVHRGCEVAQRLQHHIDLEFGKRQHGKARIRGHSPPPLLAAGRDDHGEPHVAVAGILDVLVNDAQFRPQYVYCVLGE